MSAITLGALAAFPSYFGLLWRAKTNLDDSLDVVAAHGLGRNGRLTGVFAQKAFNGVADGLLFGNPGQLGIQAVAVLSAIVYMRGDELRTVETRRPGLPVARFGRR
jgi:ammonium transporter, Amt family